MRLGMRLEAHGVACLDRHFALVAVANMHLAVQNQLRMVELVASPELDTQALASMDLIVLDRKDRVTSSNSSLEVVACPSPTTENKSSLIAIFTIASTKWTKIIRKYVY